MKRFIYTIIILLTATLSLNAQEYSGTQFDLPNDSIIVPTTAYTINTNDVIHESGKHIALSANYRTFAMSSLIVGGAIATITALNADKIKTEAQNNLYFSAYIFGGIALISECISIYHLHKGGKTLKITPTKIAYNF